MLLTQSAQYCVLTAPLILMQYKMKLCSAHIPWKLNLLPDKISRFRVTSDLLQWYGMHPQPQVILHHLQPENFNLMPTNRSKPHLPLPRILHSTNIGRNTRPLRMTYLIVNLSRPKVNLSHYLSSISMRKIPQCRLAYPRPVPNHKIQDLKPYNFTPNHTIFWSNHTIFSKPYNCLSNHL